MEPESLLERLLIKGDLVAIENGGLKLEPASGKPVPSEWLAHHQDQIITEILTRTGVDAFVFEDYSTGSYVAGQGGGVTLQFTGLLTGSNPYVIFNANLKRSRKTKSGKKGSPLPKGQFHVGKRSHFYKFWKATGLRMPTRLSVFHDYMGNLKGLLFTGDFQKETRLNAETVRPLNITHAQTIAAFNDLNMPDNCHTTSRQFPDNSQTRVPDKEIKQPPTQQGFQAISGAGKNKCGLSIQGGTDTRGNIIPLKKPYKNPKDQTVDEWSEHYDSKE